MYAQIQVKVFLSLKIPQVNKKRFRSKKKNLQHIYSKVEIKKKSAVIGNECCKDDTGEFDMKKFTILMVPQQSIMNLSQDNNILKRELVSLTS